MNSQEFVCIDCETTGLDPKQDRIIEIAATRFTLEGVIDSFESLINPDCPIPESSIAIHHITPEMVKDQPKIEEVLPHILKLVGKSIIIGHGIGFDVEIVACAADRFGIPTTIRSNLLIDTLRMARAYGESQTNSLEQLRCHFNIPQEGAHRAMSDVIVNIEVFKYLAKFYRNVNQIFDVLSKPIPLKTMPFGPHKGRQFKEIPIPYLIWASKKDFDQDLSFSLRSELKKRKNKNTFAQSCNPFKDL